MPSVNKSALEISRIANRVAIEGKIEACKAKERRSKNSILQVLPVDYDFSDLKIGNLPSKSSPKILSFKSVDSSITSSKNIPHPPPPCNSEQKHVARLAKARAINTIQEPSYLVISDKYTNFDHVKSTLKQSITENNIQIPVHNYIVSSELIDEIVEYKNKIRQLKPLTQIELPEKPRVINKECDGFKKIRESLSNISFSIQEPLPKRSEFLKTITGKEYNKLF